jgi:hypothetical protein
MMVADVKVGLCKHSGGTCTRVENFYVTAMKLFM